MASPSPRDLAKLRRSLLYSEELGIRLLQQDDREYFKWFLAVARLIRPAGAASCSLRGLCTARMFEDLAREILPELARGVRPRAAGPACLERGQNRITPAEIKVKAGASAPSRRVGPSSTTTRLPRTASAPSSSPGEAARITAAPIESMLDA